jgi:hypothetical protein
MINVSTFAGCFALRLRSAAAVTVAIGVAEDDTKRQRALSLLPLF